MMEKRKIRETIFQRREQQDSVNLGLWSDIIADKVISLPEFLSCDVVYSYVDVRNEVQTDRIMQAAWDMGKCVVVPKIENQVMNFYRIDSKKELEVGYFHIPEPTTNRPVPNGTGFMVMPGVAFDKDCRRVGYGGGFYDRYLAGHPDIFTVAVAFDFQVLDHVPTESTDKKPNYVITETATYVRQEEN